MMRSAITAIIALISILSAANVQEPAVRGGTQYQVTEQNQIIVGATELPWYDYSNGEDVQSAIDACVGAILFWKFYDVRMFAAHNTTCPPDQSFRESLTTEVVFVNGIQYALLTRETHPSSELVPGYPFDVYTTNAVGLQTSISDTHVTISWFVKI